MQIRSDVRIYTGVFLVILAALAAIVLMFHQNSSKGPKITTFQQCSAAGYPVTQGYPRQCTLPNGKIFVEQTAGRECSADNQCPYGQICQNHLCE